LGIDVNKSGGNVITVVDKEAVKKIEAEIAKEKEEIKAKLE